MPVCLRREGVVFRLLLLLLLLVSCTTTITKHKEPVFMGSIDSLGANVTRLVACEHINIDGKDVVTNGKDSTVLEIDIINGKDIPPDHDGVKKLGGSIAAIVKSALQDKNAYGHYAVLFVKVETDGAVTKRSWTGQLFASAEVPVAPSDPAR